jgi:hypothetical protein
VGGHVLLGDIPAGKRSPAVGTDVYLLPICKHHNASKERMILFQTINAIKLSGYMQSAPPCH